MHVRTLMFLLSALALARLTSGGAIAAEPVVRVEAPASGLFGEVELPLNKSRLIRADRPVAKAMLANPEVAEMMPLSDHTLYLIGRKMGSTSLALYGSNNQLISVLDLTVTPDLPTLRQRLFDVMPDQRIEVRAANDAVVLSGAIASGDQLKQALAIAENFAPGKVTNGLVLSGGQQVMLAVRFAEVQRTVAKSLGISSDVRWSSGSAAARMLTGVMPALAPFAFLGGSVTSGNWDIDLVLDALEEKGVVKTLAEPNLIAMSGETASFLAGGEFPIPVAKESSGGVDTVTIEFKEFGVKLAFTPTVVGNEAINLVVQTEVSAINRNNGITIGGLVIPGLTVRRAQTTVDLRHGESFAIAGLIRSDFSDDVAQLPGFGSIPILGTLFRSTQFQREETELVIVVTPYLARPALPGELRLPTDAFQPPSQARLFFTGGIEGARNSDGINPAAAAIPPGAGLSGPVGYVIK